MAKGHFPVIKIVLPVTTWVLFALPRSLRWWGCFQLLFTSILSEGLEDLTWDFPQRTFVLFGWCSLVGVGRAAYLSCITKLRHSPVCLCYSAQLFDEKQMAVKHQSLLLQKPNFSPSLDCFRGMFRSFWRAATTRIFWVPSFIQWVVPCTLGYVGLGAHLGFDALSCASLLSLFKSHLNILEGLSSDFLDIFKGGISYLIELDKSLQLLTFRK